MAMRRILDSRLAWLVVARMLAGSLAGAEESPVVAGINRTALLNAAAVRNLSPTEAEQRLPVRPARWPPGGNRAAGTMHVAPDPHRLDGRRALGQQARAALPNGDRILG